MAAILAALGAGAGLTMAGEATSELRAGDFRVASSRFTGRASAVTLHARFVPVSATAGAPDGYDVAVRYGPAPREARPESPARREARKRVATWTFPLEGAPPAGATMTLTREERVPPADAPAGAPGAVFELELRAGPRLRIVGVTPAEPPAAAALRAQDERALAASDVARLATALLRSTQPIAPTEEAIVVESAAATVDGTAAEARIVDDAFGGPESGAGPSVVVPARAGQKVALDLRAAVRSRTPYIDRLETATRPLPAGGAVRLDLGPDGGTYRVEAPRLPRLEGSVRLEEE